MKIKISKSSIIMGCSVLLCFAVAVVSLYMVLSGFAEYQKGVDTYDDLTQYIVSLKPMLHTSPEELDEAECIQWPQVDFDALRAINPDIVAWIICEGTDINYPIVQGSDNDYYLKHLFDGKVNGAGCLFVDSNNSPGFIDNNTVIYGHNMKSKTMFSALLEYKTQAFYDEHPQMLLLTPDGNYTIELFAGYETNAEDDSWKLFFSSSSELEAWTIKTKDRSTFISEFEISTSDRFVTLSTCTNEFDDNRYVVVGKLVQ